MADPWLTIIGLGEDAPDGLPPASLAALQEAEIIMGAARHLALLPPLAARLITWPVPFADGLPLLEEWRGARVVVLASGDPFWFGAGSVIARRLQRDEWTALPAPSSFALVAARLGWPLEATICLGLHAAPLQRLRPHLAPDQRAIVLLRDGDAVAQLARYLTDQGFGDSQLHICEALGGPRARLRVALARDYSFGDVQHPVAVGVEFAGDGQVLTLASGRADALFAHDGQITKRPIRALALSALAPRPAEMLWDIGGGSGSVAVEWCLSHPSLTACCIEPREDRAANIRANAAHFGLDKLQVIAGSAPDRLAGLPRPDAIFIGGGLSQDLLEALAPLRGVRIVAHAVTLDSEALLTTAHARFGGSLMRIEIAHAEPLGAKQAWASVRPIVQWQGIL
jgi:precorrin-6Y C5,15-methyltransferase (decarboxylating)